MLLRLSAFHFCSCGLISLCAYSLIRFLIRCSLCRNSLEEERKKAATLMETLTLEQVNSGQLQSELDAERSRNHSHRQRNQQSIEVCSALFLLQTA